MNSYLGAYGVLTASLKRPGPKEIQYGCHQSTGMMSSPEMCECELLCITRSEGHSPFPGKSSFTNVDVASMFNSP